MRKILFAQFVALSLLWSAVSGYAQGLMTLGAGSIAASVASGGGFVGPGDLSLSQTVTHYWGWSCVKASYSGPAIDLVDAATGSTTGTRLQCSGGSLVVLTSSSACATTAAGQTFISGGLCSPLATTCAVSCVVIGKWDQIANTGCSTFECDQFQTSNASRPIYTATGGAGGKACEQYTTTQSMNSAATTATVNQPFSVATIDSRTGGLTSISTVVSFGGSLTGVYHSSTAGNVLAYAGSLSSNVAATDNAFHAIQTVLNNPSSALFVDGSGGTLGTQPGTGGIGAFGSGSNGGGAFIGIWCEEIYFSGAATTGDVTAINSNQHSRFGF